MSASAGRDLYCFDCLVCCRGSKKPAPASWGLSSPSPSKPESNTSRTSLNMCEHVGHFPLIIGLLNMFSIACRACSLDDFLGRPSFVTCQNRYHFPPKQNTAQFVIKRYTSDTSRSFFLCFFWKVYGSKKSTPRIDPFMGVHPMKSSDFLVGWFIVCPISSSEFSSGCSGHQRLGTTQAWPKRRLLKSWTRQVSCVPFVRPCARHAWCLCS